MLEFFRINDPFRILAVFILMLLLGGLYLFLFGSLLLQPEMIWLLVGEAITAQKHMYIDVVDDTGPLAAGVYWILDILFGRSIWAYKVIALLIMYFQVFYVNSLFIKYKSFEENTYIPALVMGVLFFISFDLMKLSPALMGSTFVLLALGQLFSQTVLQKEDSDAVLLVGIFGGVGACFHFPLLIFLPFMIIAGVVVSGFSFRQLILSIISYILPFVGCAVYYFWMDGLKDFIDLFVLLPREIEVYSHVRFREMLFIIALPLTFSIIGLVRGTVIKSQTVNQQKQLQLSLIFLVFGLGSLLLVNRKTPYQLIVVLPVMAYLISLVFQGRVKGKMLNILASVFVFGVPLIGVSWTFVKIQNQSMTDYTVNIEAKHTISSGKKTLVLGEDLGYYHEGQFAGRYLNYRLSKLVLEDLNDFSKMASIYEDFLLDAPEIIIDENAVFSTLVQKMPALSDIYRKEGRYYYLGPSEKQQSYSNSSNYD